MACEKRPSPAGARIVGRRGFLLRAGATLCVAVAAPSVGSAQASRRIVVSTWGGANGESIRRFVIPRFEKDTGAKVTLDEGFLGARFNRLRAQRNSSGVDVFASNAEVFYLGLKEGLFAEIDGRNVPNVKRLYDWAVPERGYGPAYHSVGVGLAFHSQKIVDPPRRWADLWAARFEGLVGMFSFAHSMAPHLLIRAAELGGGGIHNIDAGFARLKSLKPAKVYPQSPDALQLFNQGSISLYPDFNYYVQNYRQRKVPIEIAVPEDGLLMSINVLNIVQGSKNKELSELFINAYVDSEAETNIAREYFMSPSSRDVKIEPAFAARLIVGDKMENARRYDAKIIAARRPFWQERFNAEIAPAWQN